MVQVFILHLQKSYRETGQNKSLLKQNVIVELTKEAQIWTFFCLCMSQSISLELLFADTRRSLRPCVFFACAVGPCDRLFSLSNHLETHLSFMPNCISGISMRSRGSLVWCSTISIIFAAVVALYRSHQGSQETLTKRRDGSSYIKFFVIILINPMKNIYIYIYRFKKRSVLMLHCSVNTIPHTAVYNNH